MPNSQVPPQKVKLGKAIYFDCSTKQLFSKQHTIALNRAEREVLYSLVSNAPRMVSKADLLQAGWARKEVAATSLFQTIRNLRIKLKEEEKGQIIELIPKLGYKIITTPYEEPIPQSNVEEHTKRERFKRPKLAYSIVTTLVLCGLIILSGVYYHSHNEKFYHQVVTDDDNNTIVLLSNQEEDLAFLLNHNNQYIVPKKINNKLFFLAKSNEYYSIAFCEKTVQNYCDPATARAVTFKHFDLNSFWPLLTEESLSIGAMSVYKDDIKIKASAKSYNLYLEDGKISPNLSQYFIHKIKPYTWSFTGVSYRMNNNTKEFVATSFKGGKFTLRKTTIEPFIAATRTNPEYFYWINSKEELQQMGIALPSKIESYVNSLFKQTVGYDTYMLFRQPELYLWYSDRTGFYWLNKQGLEASNFSEFNQFAKCRNFLRLNQTPECD
ncbi:winged helix-turn-helix domain-containing protein [Photobacterium sp. SDRW27]|uniref:winged helix-turn-helix domain-containing protein n=1 Tax=Photobacterium obscurum TaxID=2829490 RepID=UPI00224422D9|nr:winged helix-turn-helix domain-containing protein [Photobacterium obscurum]MCW8329294.1 winged helix-turn-helix domain-containing protein [Photobacterium obscurum]